MNKKYARELSETITNQELFDMLEKAKTDVKDWTKASKANKGLSRGINWNLFCKGFNINKTYSSILKYRMIEEFGEFLPESLQPVGKSKPKLRPPSHEDPIF